MSPHRQRQILTAACVCALLALALIVWSLVDPRPVPVVLAMSVAQGLGTLSLLAYLLVVVDDLRQAHVLGKAGAGAPSAPPAPPTPAPAPPASAPPAREDQPS